MPPFDPVIGPDAAFRSAPDKQLEHLEAEFTGIDTHTHVFKRDKGFIEGRRYTPAYDASIADFVTMLDDHRMSHGVLVQISILGTDNSYLLQALRQYPNRLRGIVVLNPGINVDELHALDNAGVVGVRLNLIGVSTPDLCAPEWQAHLRLLAELNWQVEVQAEAGRLSLVLPPLLAAGVPVVIDHFGRPDEALGIDDPGFQYLLTLGRTRSVWVKLSGSYRNGSPDRGQQIAKAATSALLGEFGAERLIWGSDWPHTSFEEPKATDAAHQALSFWIPSEAERKTVLIDTPRRLFRFDAKSS